MESALEVFGKIFHGLDCPLKISRHLVQEPEHFSSASIADLISKLVYQVLKPTHPAIKKPNHKADSHLVLLTRCSLKLLGKPAV